MKSNKQIIKEFIDATNAGDWKKVLSLVHADFVRHSSSTPHEIKTNTGLVEFHQHELTVFPDLQETVIFLIEEMDLVAARIGFTGTQSGWLGPFPPSGKKMNAAFNCIFRITDGKIKETWVEYDQLNGLIQLGHYSLHQTNK